MTPHVDHKTLWEIRAKRGRDVAVSVEGPIGTSYGQIKQYQREFQEQFCQSCGRFDLETNAFMKTGHSLNAEDCYWHWTDIIGQCWNYAPRPEEGK